MSSSALRKTEEYPVNDFEVDEENKVIYFAGKSWDTFRTYKKCFYVCADLLDYNDIEPISSKVPRSKVFTNKYGITPSNFKRVFNAIMRRLWVEPVEDVAMMMCFTKGMQIDSIRLMQIWAVKEIIDQCREDGLMHIVPLVVLLKQDPKGLKKLFGKRYWKILANNSKTRNLLIAKAVIYHTFKEDIINIIKCICDLNTPSTALKAMPHIVRGEAYLYAYKYLKTEVGRVSIPKDKIVRLNHIKNIINDTQDMCGQLGRDFNPSWSLRKLKEKHDECSKLILERKYSSEVFPELSNIPIRGVVCRGYTAKLLDNAKDIAAEGSAMGHCVAGYINSCRVGRYLVYSITKDGQRVSTLGINIVSHFSNCTPAKLVSTQYEFNQHYGKYNSYVEDNDEKYIANHVVTLLNGGNYEI